MNRCEGKYTAFDMWFAFADDWPVGQQLAPGRALLFLDQIKREKGVWWMPWQ